MILVDTNVVSEFMRPEVDPSVVRWAWEIPPSGLVLSSITIQEIELGIRRLPEGARQDRIRAAWTPLLARFARSVADYDSASATRCAEALADSARRGITMSVLDAQIAGTCLAHDHALATRNVKDFGHLPGLRIINPFEQTSG